MRIPQATRLGAVALLSVAGVKVNWLPFSSTVYPYTVSQPSSFRHYVFQDAANRSVDYFFPSLGSYTTNVNIYAVPGHDVANEKEYLRSIGASNVHRSMWLTLMGQRRPLICGDFKGLVGHWTIEQTTFATPGLVWRLTASYDIRYRKLMRSTLIRILKSFHLRG